MAHRRVVTDGHHGHYGTTSCSKCGEDTQGHYDECPHCKVRFDEPTTYE